MTINLTEREMAALEELCELTQMNKTAVVRQALRLYQLVTLKTEEGGKLYVEDKKRKSKSELIVL